MHVTFSRLMVAALSCRLAFKHARKALTASDRSVQQRQQPSFQLVPTAGYSCSAKDFIQGRVGGQTQPSSQAAKHA